MRPRSLGYAAALVALVVALGLVAAGCSGSDGSDGSDGDLTAVDVITLPDDLCPDVLGVVTKDWGLAETSHETQAGATESTATCALDGDRDGPVTLTATITAYGDDGDDRADDRVSAAVEEACDDLVHRATGDVDQDDGSCQATLSPGTVSGVYALPTDHAMLALDMSHTGTYEGSVAVELAHLSLAFVGGSVAQ